MQKVIKNAKFMPAETYEKYYKEMVTIGYATFAQNTNSTTKETMEFIRDSFETTTNWNPFWAFGHLTGLW